MDRAFRRLIEPQTPTYLPLEVPSASRLLSAALHSAAIEQTLLPRKTRCLRRDGILSPGRWWCAMATGLVRGCRHSSDTNGDSLRLASILAPHSRRHSRTF